MASEFPFDVKQQFEDIKKAAIEAIRQSFPIDGQKHRIELKDVWIDDVLNISDLASQKQSKMGGKSWAVPVFASLVLKDSRTGKTLDAVSKMRLMDLPKITDRSSYIVEGNEYQVVNQLRLRPGIYTRIKANGQLESAVNLAKGGGFKVEMDPERGTFNIVRQTSNIKLYPVLRDLGISDDKMRSAWGKEIFDANVHSSRGTMDTEIKKFHNALKLPSVKGREESISAVKGFLSETVLDPETTKMTMGKSFSTFDAETLLETSKRILQTSRQEKPPDDRDSMVFKSVHAVDDFVRERLRLNSEKIKKTILNKLDKRENIREIMSKQVFNDPLKTMFTNTAISAPTEQTNPLHMLSGHMKLTIMGEGGIQNEQAISEGARSVHPSEFGFVDPVMTPQSGQVGAVTRLAMGIKKRGNKLHTTVVNVKSGKVEHIDAIKFNNSIVAFPDQYRKNPQGGKPIPVSQRVKVMKMDNEVGESDASRVDYVLINPESMFSISTNLVPFLNSTQGNRALMASSQYEQATGLKHRETPLVQVDTGFGETAEASVGRRLAHTAPVSGEVVKVEDEYIHIKSTTGEIHKVGIYKDFPLNQKTFMNAEVKVKVGDKVKKGQVLADNNYTKDGVLSMGTNLRVAYLPSKGYNFEDGVVISESASKKLTSEHMHKVNVSISEGGVTSKSKFMAYAPGHIKPSNASKLDDDGIIMEGQRVEYGDIVIAYLSKRSLSPDSTMVSRLHKALVKNFTPRPEIWNYEFPGVVTKVVKSGREVTVYIKTEEPATIGDKLSGRYGNKGIISKILPDAEMPHTAGGDHMEILLNPIGIPSRLNPGQVLETAASKIADKTGKAYTVPNFKNEDNHAMVLRDMKKLGLKDKEILYDPEDGKPLGSPVMTGKQFMLKLDHPVRKKFSARSGGPGAGYTVDMQPASSPGKSGMSMDQFTVFAMLAHGARDNLREMATYKAEKNDEFWRALQLGQPLPAPKPTFAFEKFTNMLKASGVNVEKKGNELSLMPMTDQHVADLSAGKIQNSGMLKGKNLAPEKGGLFDPEITGGSNGSNWAHIELNEPIPNPVFEGAIKSVLGIKQKEYDDIVSGKKFVNESFQPVDPGSTGALTGGAAIHRMLNNIDVDETLQDLRTKAQTAKPTQLDKLNKQIRYLRALKRSELSPTSYVITKVPVIPPKFRPIYPMPDGSLNTSDPNYLYRDLNLVNEKLKDLEKAPDSEKQDLRRDLYKGMKALAGLGNPITYKNYRGYIELIKGRNQPKSGFYQKKLIRRRQDMTGRSTIVPEPALNVDQVGLPKQMAWEIYKPHVVRELVQRGYTPLSAQEQVNDQTPIAFRALETAIDNRPVMLNRAPTLHKHGVMAFKPVLTDGKTIKIHPLVVKGFNADFDGDNMSVHVPASEKARVESFKMLPTNNIFDASTGDVMLMPAHEMVLGLYFLTREGNPSKKTFGNVAEAKSAFDKGEIKVNSVIQIAGNKTTLGRAMVNGILPAKFRDPSIFLNKKSLHELLKKIAKEDKENFGGIVDALKDLGNNHAFKTGFSVGLDDIAPLKNERAKAVAMANSIMKGKNTDSAKIDAFTKATPVMTDLMQKSMSKKDNALFHMFNSGARGSSDEIRQIVAAPMLVQDYKDDVIPQPITKSYSEGLDAAGYWSSMYGARAGTIGKSLQTRVPGYFSKRVTSSVMGNVVTKSDCGTSKGIDGLLGDRDTQGRFLADGNPEKVGKKNDVVTSNTISKARALRLTSIKVRSPLTCEASEGVCVKCFGHTGEGNTLQIGDNAGVIAATAMTEPLVQMSMNAFHTGGVAGASGGLAAISQGYDRVAQILELPDVVKGKATLATVDGSITKIDPNPAGGHFVYVGQEQHFVPQSRRVAVKIGQNVLKGDYLSDGVAKPQELADLKGMHATRQYMTTELQKAYNKPVRRNFFEAAVKEMTNLAKVIRPGTKGDFEAGDMAPMSKIEELNRKGAGIIFEPVMKGINTLPLASEDWMARLGTRDLAKTIREGAARGWSSNIHGTHPIPGYVYGAEFGQGTEGKY